ncbi:MAG TPA: hypothetical protein VHR66_08145 [Gemmataceae bacterium]|jgi:hypothetical protein|nr:hypothetical protein [Gemmataceae bacterium]
MAVDTNVRLGVSVNLIAGFNPAWNPSVAGSPGLFAVPEPALKFQAPEIADTQATWSYPTISLHESADSVLSALFPYKVIAPTDEINPPCISAGPLLTQDRDRATALQSLSASLGVDLANSGLKYALVRLQRLVGSASHSCLSGTVIPVPDPVNPDPALGVEEGFRSELVRLRHGAGDDVGFEAKSVSVSDATGYLQFFAKRGSHFVATITGGDIIFQVFAYTADKFQRVQSAYADGTNVLSGSGAVSFQYFTTDANTGAFGYVSGYGKVLSMIGSQAILKSVAAGDWKETTWAERDSIFAVYQSQSKVAPDRLNRDFTENGAAQIELLSLAAFAEFKRRQIWRQVLKAALFQKFPTGIQPNFGKPDSRDFRAMLPEYDEGFLSTIATPTVNTFKSRMDLSSMQFVAASEVRDFTLLSNVVQQDNPALNGIPGTSVTLIAQVFDMQSLNAPPQIGLTDAAYDNLTLSCQEFLGTARIVNQNGNKWLTVSEGLVYETTSVDANNRGVVAVTRDARTPPAPAKLTALQSNLEFSLAFAEAVTSNQCCPKLSPVTELMRAYLSWFGDLIPGDTNDVGLSGLRMRALDLARVLTEPGQGTFVPLLPSADYQAQVRSILDYLDAINRKILEYRTQIAERKQAELTIDVAQKLNQNIVNTGKLLTQVVDANAAQQKDLAGYYTGIITYQKSELEQQQIKIAQIEADLAKSQSDVNVAVEAYKNAVKTWETMQWVKFGLDVATNLFALGTSIAIPASAISSVKELGLAVQRVQKFFNVMNALSKVYTTAQSSIDTLKNANKTLDGLDDVVGSADTLGWDQMQAQFKDVLATGPSDASLTSVKSQLDTAFGLLVTTGKALSSAKGAAQTMARDIYLNQQQTAINQKQADRLTALKGFLQPTSIDSLDRSKIDLIGLTGGLSSLRDQMMGMLARSFVLQDQSLQYEWLQPATAISSFNLLQFRGAIVQQQSATITAKTAMSQLQATQTTPIELLIPKVPVDQMTNGNAYEFGVDLQNSSFLQYVDARVSAALVAIDGVEATDSSSYLVNLEFPGNVFFDRNPARQPMTFRTLSRQRTYEYQVKDNVPKFVDNGSSWSADVNPVTPFGIWKIRLPKTEKNKGLKFNGVLADVRLSFSLNARIKDAPAFMSLPESVRRTLLRITPAAAPVGLGATPGPQTEALVAAMNKQGSALNGWDVVFNLSLPRINAAMREQYDQFKADPKFKNVIDVTTSEPIPGTKLRVDRRFYMEYGYPSLQFPADQPMNVSLEMAILGSSFLETITFQDGKQIGDDKQPLGGKGEMLQAIIPMGKVAGLVNNNKQILSVVVEMAQGSFTAKNMNLTDEVALEFNTKVKAYFVANPVRYLINSLDLTNITTLPALTPSQFVFKSLIPKTNRPCLQLYITTAGRAALNYSQAQLNNIDDPIPEGSECSLMISSKVMFDSVLPSSLSTKGWTLGGVKPASDTAAWSSKFTVGSVGGNVDLSAMNKSSSQGSQAGVTTTTQTVTIPGGNHVSWSIDGMTLVANSSGALTLALNKAISQVFNVQTCSQFCGMFGCGKNNCGDQNYTTSVNVTIGATLPVSVGGTGRDQQIKIAVTGNSVNLDGKMSGGGPCGCDDLQAQFNQQLRNQVPGQVASQVSVSFTPMSLFALKNLLFPSKNYINFAGAYIPGDALIVGTFTKDG